MLTSVFFSLLQSIILQSLNSDWCDIKSAEDPIFYLCIQTRLLVRCGAFLTTNNNFQVHSVPINRFSVYVAGFSKIVKIDFFSRQHFQI